MPKGISNNGYRQSSVNLARGTKVGHMVKGAYNLDPETHYQIRALALKNNCSFSEQMRLLLEWGLEVDADNR